MKICHLIFSFTTGGAETMLVDIMNEQCKTEEIHLVVVNNIYNKDVLKKISDRVKIHLIKRKSGSRSIIPIIELNITLYNIKPDFIHCHNFELAKIIFTNLLNFKIGLTVHDVYVSTSCHNKYHKLFAISKAVQKAIKDRSGYDSIVVLNGINFSKFKKKYNYKSKIYKIVQVSSLNYEKKGQDIIIKAMNILVNKMKITDIRIDFIGEGESEDYLKILVKEYNLEEYINFLGLKTREYLYNNLHNYDLLLQPSRYEGFGLTVVEAMAAKVPVLVSNIHGPIEIIQGGKYGDWFESENIDDCANKIYQLYSDKNQILNKTKVAYEYSLNKYSVKQTAFRYLKLYLDSKIKTI